MQELERGDSGLRSFASVQGSLVMYPIHTFGSEEQKQQLPARDGEGRDHRLLRPDRARLRLEPERDAHGGASTTATRYVLNGTKRWITNGNLAQVALVWAKVGGVDGEVRGFLVPTDTRGLRGAAHPQEGEPARERHERADSRGRARRRRTPSSRASAA